MNIDRLAVLAALAGAAALLLVAAPAPAQPLPPGAPPSLGQGPGFHDPRSAFKPLVDREGVLSWQLLSSVKTEVKNQRVVPQFPPAVQVLHNQKVRVQGFMLPLEPGERQRHFLLSAVPTTCSFCVPAGPEGLVEVRTRSPVKFSLEPVVVEGRLSVLADDAYGMYYRIADAAPVP